MSVSPLCRQPIDDRWAAVQSLPVFRLRSVSGWPSKNPDDYLRGGAARRPARQAVLDQRPEDGRVSFIAFVLTTVAFEIFLTQVLKIGDRDWSWAKTLTFASAMLIFGGVLRAFLEHDRRNQKDVSST